MSKRISTCTVNWSLISEKTKPDLKGKILTFRSKLEKHLKNVSSKPAELPKIDWSHYKSKIFVPGLVDTFQKKYEALKIPYPSDEGYISEIDKDETKWLDLRQKDEENFKIEIERLTAVLKHLEAALPYSQMTMEELMIAKLGLDVVNDPELWNGGLNKDENEKKH